jgi:hypothetical protein
MVLPVQFLENLRPRTLVRLIGDLGLTWCGDGVQTPNLSLSRSQDDTLAVGIGPVWREDTGSASADAQNKQSKRYNQSRRSKPVIQIPSAFLFSPIALGWTPESIFECDC